MATTSPDNIRTPDPGDPYNLVPDLQTLAQDVQDALTDRANTYTGTVAQRTAFSASAPDGALWVDTDGSKHVWRRDGVGGGGSWVRLVPDPTGYSSWVNVTPLAGWTAGTGGNSPQVRHGFGMIQFRGSMYGGTPYTNAFSIPPGFPAFNTQRVPMVLDSGNAGVAVLFSSGFGQFSGNTNNQSQVIWSHN